MAKAILFERPNLCKRKIFDFILFYLRARLCPGCVFVCLRILEKFIAFCIFVL